MAGGVTPYRAFEVTASRQFALVERERQEPAPGQVRIRVDACGVCHSDVLAVEGLRHDPSRPVVPGHEIVGTIEAVGDHVDATWSVGDRVGVGFLSGQDNVCPACRRGDFLQCTDQPWTGTHVDGGYAEVAYARATGLVRLPTDGAPTDLAPLLCAGLTVFNAVLSSRLRPGAVVAVQGIGGLGHLGIQYAKALGHPVVAIARGAAKATLAMELGADDYIDSAAEDPGEALRRLGGVDAVVATAASGASMSPLIAGLAPHGQLVVAGAAPDPIQVTTPDLIFGDRIVRGALTGTAAENEDNLRFTSRHGIRSYNEIVPLSQAPQAYERMLSGDARFRVVLDAHS
ncbi:alcohol dehydrogenase catalytic domain-containing protein [Humibacillus xanthopallidus]|uniref:Propanol-preferring alcohol dehydrogenase n=1 Tax=Humibacillus xanthopallidus TaxID=412689 RepID=A0A543I285_9MICO|nr:alcohol dehydrogenase catalytic domain-containing protein [Humibacillus xanthopallidus]TQM64709.1 propanol-preferring alcohol dehydrogenase [Humibacillus xanthopallidus]